MRKLLLILCTISLLLASPAFATTYCVSGAGSTDWNGEYSDGPATPGIYALDWSHLLMAQGSGWFFTSDMVIQGPSVAYSAEGSLESPVGLQFRGASIGWKGVDPGPTVTLGSCTPPTATPVPTSPPTAISTPTAMPTPTNTPAPGSITLPEFLCLTDHVGAQTSMHRIKPTSPIVGPKETPYIEYVAEGDSYIKLYGTFLPTTAQWKETPTSGNQGLVLSYRNDNDCLGMGSLLCDPSSKSGKKYVQNKDCSGLEFFNSVYRQTDFEILDGAEYAILSIVYSMAFRSPLPSGWYWPITSQPGNRICYAGLMPREISYTISEEDCRFNVPMDSNTITGNLDSTYADVRAAAANSSQLFVAMLYSGTSPSADEAFRAPKAYAFVSDGHYSFEKVPSGDYHITFRTLDGFRFNPPYVSVSAITGGTVTASPVSAEEIKYADTGCTKTVVYPYLSRISFIGVRLKELIGKQARYNEKAVTDRRISSATRSRFLRTIGRAQNIAQSSFIRLTVSLLTPPLTIREACPKANGCALNRLNSTISSMRRSFRRMRAASASISTAGARLLSKTSIRKNARYLRKVRHQYDNSLKVLTHIPRNSYICPEQ